MLSQLSIWIVPLVAVCRSLIEQAVYHRRNAKHFVPMFCPQKCLTGNNCADRLQANSGGKCFIDFSLLISVGYTVADNNVVQVVHV